MKKPDLSHFYVVTIISNTARFSSRYNLFRKYEKMIKDTGVTLITVEMALGDRAFEVTERDNPHHLQLRSIDELWHKENMINLGISYLLQLDPEAKYVCWIDGDVMPMMPAREWLEETWHQLQVYEVVQMFQYAQDMDPDFNPIGERQEGFISTYIRHGGALPNIHMRWASRETKGYSEFGHPGFAWAANISALSAVGGLPDTHILGAGDRFIAMGLIGATEKTVYQGLSEDYKQSIRDWGIKAERYLKRDVGFVKGCLLHMWHGSKKQRFYIERWKVLIDNKFSPARDLKRDAQGLWQLETHSPRQIKLRDQIRAYMRSRNEDCIYTGRDR